MTYTWSFASLDCVIGPDSAGNEDIVFNVKWMVGATDGEYSAREYGQVGVTYEEGLPFIVYADLTEADVQGWCEEALDVDAIKERLDTSIDLQRNPVVTTLDPPWPNGG